jgi:predicted RNA-binding Zn-ribbon protein involved in translation (DUF1610 family)
VAYPPAEEISETTTLEVTKITYSGDESDANAAHPVRKPCPFCGNPMKPAPDEIREWRERYVCAKCDDADPLKNTVVQRWMESSLKPPGK